MKPISVFDTAWEIDEELVAIREKQLQCLLTKQVPSSVNFGEAGQAPSSIPVFGIRFTALDGFLRHNAQLFTSLSEVQPVCG